MITAHFNEIRANILKEIYASKKSLKIAVAWFTNYELFIAILQKCKDKIPVELIIINDSINLKKFGLDFNLFIQEGGVLYFGESETLMHHKFCIIDDKILVNGSYNWTYWAETQNNENITIIKEEDELLEKFDAEFAKITVSKKAIQNVDSYIASLTYDKNNFFNLNTIRVDEYIGSAIDIGNRGNEELSIKIFAEVNKINPSKTNNILQAGIIQNNKLIYKVYQSLALRLLSESKENTYEEYCNSIQNFIDRNDFINAIILANTCASKFRGKFSVHVYCGDAKVKLNDKLGAEIEYQKALNYTNHFQTGGVLIYYNQKYNYPFFPKADIYRKLGEKERIIEVLEEAVRVYKQKNIPTGVAQAENYLKKLKNNEDINVIKLK